MDRQALSSFVSECLKLAEAGDADIDDLYASPPEAIMPYLRRAHGLRKGSSWTEIGPVGQRSFLHGYTASLALFVRK